MRRSNNVLAGSEDAKQTLVIKGSSEKVVFSLSLFLLDLVVEETLPSTTSRPNRVL